MRVRVRVRVRLHLSGCAFTCPQRHDVAASLSDDGNYVRCVTPAYNATAGAAAVEERVDLSLNPNPNPNPNPKP